MDWIDRPEQHCLSEWCGMVYGSAEEETLRVRKIVLNGASRRWGLVVSVLECWIRCNDFCAERWGVLIRPRQSRCQGSSRQEDLVSSEPFCGPLP